MARMRPLSDRLAHPREMATSAASPFRRHLNRRRQDRQRELIFQRIHDENLWLGAASRSGPGSDLSHTEAIRRELPQIVERLEIRSLVDVPCGDFYWMQHVPLAVDYTGLDIVPVIIASNQRYASSSRRFRRHDMVSQPLPRADLVLSRDGLVHLSFDDGLRAVANIVRSRSRYLLASTFVSTALNVDVPTGGWRPLNLSAPPFNFPPPLHTIHERLQRDTHRDKAIGLWRVADLP